MVPIYNILRGRLIKKSVRNYCFKKMEILIYKNYEYEEKYTLMSKIISTYPKMMIFNEISNQCDPYLQGMCENQA